MCPDCRSVGYCKTAPQDHSAVGTPQSHVHSSCMEYGSIECEVCKLRVCLRCVCDVGVDMGVGIGVGVSLGVCLRPYLNHTKLDHSLAFQNLLALPRPNTHVPKYTCTHTHWNIVNSCANASATSASGTSACARCGSQRSARLKQVCFHDVCVRLRIYVSMYATLVFVCERVFENSCNRSSRMHAMCEVCVCAFVFVCVCSDRQA